MFPGGRGERVKYSQGNPAVLCHKNLPTGASRIGGEKKNPTYSRKPSSFFTETHGQLVIVVTDTLLSSGTFLRLPQFFTVRICDFTKYYISASVLMM